MPRPSTATHNRSCEPAALLARLPGRANLRIDTRQQAADLTGPLTRPVTSGGPSHEWPLARRWSRTARKWTNHTTQPPPGSLHTYPFQLATFPGSGSNQAFAIGEAPNNGEDYSHIPYIGVVWQLPTGSNSWKAVGWVSQEPGMACHQTCGRCTLGICQPTGQLASPNFIAPSPVPCAGRAWS